MHGFGGYDLASGVGPVANFTLIDTDVLIDAGRGVREAVTCLQELEQHAVPAISVISQMELLIGCHNKSELRSLDRFLQRFHIFKLNEQSSEIAIDLLRKYRLSHGLLIADALIAATALSLNVSFLTKNRRDYRFLKGLRLLSYPQPFPKRA